MVTGDVTQVDLPGSTRSGLQVVRDILDGVDDVHFSYLTSTDVVRHRLVGDIVDAYARFDAASPRQRSPPRRARARRRTHPRLPPLTGSHPDGCVVPVGWARKRACELASTHSSAAKAADERSEEDS